MGTDFLKAEATEVALFPGVAGAAAVGEPEEGGGKVGDILKREPDVAREGDGRPGEGLGLGGGDGGKGEEEDASSLKLNLTDPCRTVPFQYNC